MKKILDSRLFWFLVSLVVSLGIWVYVTSLESDEYKQTFRGVRVELVGEGVLRDSRNMVVTGLSTSTVSLEVVGPRRVVASLSPENITAQIDVSKLSQSSYASMAYTVSYPNGTDTADLSVTRKIPDTINFNVSKLNTKSVPVRGSFDGSVAPGFTAEPLEFEPAEISLSGPEAYLRNISYAWVSFTAGEISSTYKVDTGFTLMTEDGQPAIAEAVTCSADVITAKVPIMEMKDLQLTVNLIYAAGANENNVKVTVEPSQITLAGDSAILSAMNNIPIATVDLSEFTSTFTETYPINYDNSLSSIDGITEAKVTVEIVGLETKTFTIDNIHCTNVTDGYEAEVLSKSINVRLRGTAENLALVHSVNLRAVADLTDYDVTTGTINVPVKIYVDGSTEVGALDDYTVTVEIRKA